MYELLITNAGKGSAYGAYVTDPILLETLLSLVLFLGRLAGFVLLA